MAITPHNCIKSGYLALNESCLEASICRQNFRMSTVIFFDSEFTNLSSSASFISAGFAAENGEEFYAELSDFEASNCNDFVKATVLPLLVQNRISAYEFVQHLVFWMGQFDGDVVLVEDSDWDRKILSKTFASVKKHLPPNWTFRKVPDYFPTGHQRQAFNDEINAYFLRHPEERPLHALSDARAIGRAYNRAETD